MKNSICRLLFVSVWSLNACDEAPKTKVAAESNSGSTNDPAKCAPSAKDTLPSPGCEPFQVTDASKIVVSPGDEVVLTGKNFRPTLTVAASGLNVPSGLKVTVMSDTKASLLVADSTGFGLVDATLTQDGLSQKVTLLSNGGRTDFPVITASADQICQGMKFYDLSGSLQAGTKVCGAEGSAVSPCQTDGQVGCVTVSDYPAVKRANINAAQILLGSTIAGVSGTAQSRPDCSADGEIGCVAVPAFRAVQMSKLTPGVIKKGTIIANVAGLYPSADHKLDGATSMEDLPAFAATTGGSTYQWFQADGTRLTGSIDLAAVTVSGITPWDLRAGKTVGGIAGKLEFYRNMVNIDLFNRTGMESSPDEDIYDTIDDYNAGVESPLIPTYDPWKGMDVTPGSNWTDAATGAEPPCSSTGPCVLRDEITGNLWARPAPVDAPEQLDWENAIDYCANLTIGGSSDWRLPTQKELMQAYVNGIWANKTNLNLKFYHWSSTTQSDDTYSAWFVDPSSGYTHLDDKSVPNDVLCVR